jgi:hypothetical protein
VNKFEAKNVSRKRTVVALVLTCVVLSTSFGIAVGAYAVAINDKSSQISHLASSYNSTFQLMLSGFSNLQNQSIPILDTSGATFVTINQINLNPAKWANEKVVVVGKLSGPWAYPEAISYYFVLSLSDTITSSTGLSSSSIGVDFGNQGALYNGSIAMVVGEVKKGIVGTNSPQTVYYIEEQAVALF